jgi:hypothetical protein
MPVRYQAALRPEKYHETMESWNTGMLGLLKKVFLLSNPPFHHSLPTGGQA